MIFRLDQDNNLQLAYIECKQNIPNFNNNPPKMNKNCIYICGNKIFNGFLLTTQDWQDKKNEYIERLNSLREEYTSENMRIVSYRVIELPWNGGRGPQTFIDREEQNIPLITDCLSRLSFGKFLNNHLNQWWRNSIPNLFNLFACISRKFIIFWKPLNLF